ncbi:MAG TPA: hypothetical protein VFV27_07940 [Nevskiaceae bacterium]|nr:hypothetical protein [Nevskiaceae bacterium]
MSAVANAAPLSRADRLVDRTLGGLVLMLLHEIEAANAHRLELGERLAVARRARDAGELLRDQLDLLPESRRRLARDHRVRRELWRGLWRDLQRG